MIEEERKNRPKENQLERHSLPCPDIYYEWVCRKDRDRPGEGLAEIDCWRVIENELKIVLERLCFYPVSTESSRFCPEGCKIHSSKNLICEMDSEDVSREIICSTCYGFQ